MPEALERALASALTEALARPVRLRGLRPVGGGCISESVRLDTDAGAFFAKWNHGAPRDLFMAESTGLRALGSAGSGLAMPRVLGAREPLDGVPGFIVMEYLEPRPSQGADDEETLGRGLAAIHRTSAPTFGFECVTYCGSTPQPNEPCGSWVEFYAQRRLLPLLEAITRERGLPASQRSVYDRLIARLPELLGTASSTPALIHGDLWSGNVMHTARGPALVDPACAFAEREMEFGITSLFGGLSPRAWAAYAEAFPLAPGWRERSPIYQLYHLLNHHLLFGGGYGAQALASARRFA